MISATVPLPIQQIPIQPIPNQSFTVVLDNVSFDIVLKFTVNVMSATISADGVLLVQNTRVVPGFPIIPYRYLEQGNFVIQTLNDDYPNYEQFGTSQQLIYASQEQLELIRGG